LSNTERQAGIPTDLLIESHGSFHSASCAGRRVSISDHSFTPADDDPDMSDSDISSDTADSELGVIIPGCGRKYDMQFVKSAMANGVPRCECGGIIKPDIVFYGEQPHAKFYSSLTDFETCDALVIMGTSLGVAPFSLLINLAGDHVPRLLINLEHCSGFDFGGGRDAFYQGTCDEGVALIMKEMGWEFPEGDPEPPVKHVVVTDSEDNVPAPNVESNSNAEDEIDEIFKDVPKEVMAKKDTDEKPKEKVMGLDFILASDTNGNNA
jgi:Sir2 family